jgi:KRAB domain-containing zinc finger protein
MSCIFLFKSEHHNNRREQSRGQTVDAKDQLAPSAITTTSENTATVISCSKLKPCSEGRKHIIPPPRQCESCGWRFPSQSQLNQHLHTHTGERPYVCRVPNCAKRFLQSSGRIYHERSAHSDSVPFICTQCGQRFKHAVLLRRHYIMHSGERPYVCSVCNASFSRLNGLKVHEMRHTGEKLCVCQTCQRRFMTKRQMKHHENAVHARLKPFVCTVCDRAFTLVSNMHVHMRTHTGEKPFDCTTCGLKFAHSGTLKNHLKTHADRNKT